MSNIQKTILTKLKNRTLVKVYIENHKIPWYGYLFFDDDRPYIKTTSGLTIKVDKGLTICLSTGLMDKNKQLIFENDIVRGTLAPNSLTKEVFEGVCQFDNQTGGYVFGRHQTSSTGATKVTVGRLKDKVVVGSIFESVDNEID